MPIYEYRCNACGHKLEALQKLSEAPLLTCPQCKADALAKQLSVAGFQLKGSGWYATDFKNSGKQPAKPNGTANGTDGANKGTDTATKGVDAKAGGADKSSGSASEPAAASSAPASGSGGCSSSS